MLSVKWTGENQGGLLRIILLALAPSLLWLWWFWVRGGKREPLDPLARAFIFGALAIVPALVMEDWGATFMPKNFMIGCFLVVGPAEETFKLLATLLALRSPHGARTTDRIVVGAAAALGFAFAENLFFFIKLSPAAIALRMLATVPAHVLISVPWAVALSRARKLQPRNGAFVVMTLALSSFLHGAYDALMFSIGSSPLLVLLLFALLLTILWVIYHKRLGEVKGKYLETRLHDLNRPLQWKWVGFIFIIGLVVSVLLTLAAKIDFPWHSPQYSSETMGAGIIIGLFFTGFIAPFCAPHKTVTMRESALGLTLLGGCVGLLLGKQIPMIVDWTVGLALIGALGGWLGEMLKPIEGA
jgi:RsiW-degrading membrane proteinase PrsW (M82 family)